MIQLIVFLILALVSAVTLVCLLISGCLWLVSRARHKPVAVHTSRVRRLAAVFAGTLVLNAAWTALSQWNAHTPAIKEAEDGPSGSSVATLTKVSLHGRSEWISIRGRDTRKPVLLFLAGGPGGTQMAAVRHALADLEKHFVVVNWDQPGSGKSFGAVKTRNLTVSDYVEDGYALTQYLKTQFSQNSIYLIGESWGSALGIFLIRQYPELYKGFIGTGQMVDFSETERLDYAKAMEMAENSGDAKQMRRLEKNGVPPYREGGVALKSAVYLNYLSDAMAADPRIHNAGYHTLRDIGSPEYGILDKINFFRGVVSTFDQVYPQLYGTDLRKEAAVLKVPVAFFEGRHDLNAPTVLAEEYFECLQAPRKEMVWFEHSGHNPWLNESEAFIREVLRVFRQE